MLVRQRPVPPSARLNAGATAYRVLNHIRTRPRVLARCQGAPLPVPEVAAPLESDGPAAPAAANIIPAGSLRLRVSYSSTTRTDGDGMAPNAPHTAAAAPAAAPPPVVKEPRLPLWVALSDAAAAACAQRPGAVLAGLKALRAIGVWGVTVGIDWAAAEPAPRAYDWGAFAPVASLAREAGLKLQVDFRFHAAEPPAGAGSRGSSSGSSGNSGGRRSLPDWVLEAGRAVPDIFYTDRSGRRCRECLSLGADDVPVIAGRTALECYSDLMAAFAAAHADLLGTTVTDVLVGLGPGGELRYPSHPPPASPAASTDGGSGLGGGAATSAAAVAAAGVGEFMSYDAFMRASLAAAALAAGSPQWGVAGGPPDAGGARFAPHQTGFFAPGAASAARGWRSDYGQFYLEWYTQMLARHADRVLGAARAALGARVRLHAALPLMRRWRAAAARPAEATAGFSRTSPEGDEYLPALLAFARHGVAAVISGGELGGIGGSDSSSSNGDAPASNGSGEGGDGRGEGDGEFEGDSEASPEALLLQLRGAAAAVGVPASLANLAGAPCFAPRALAALEAAAFDGTGCYRGVDAPAARRLVYRSLGDAMFAPPAWTAFRGWAARVCARGGAAVAANAAAAAARPPVAAGVEQPQAAPAQQQQQQQQGPQQRPQPEVVLIA